MFGNFSFNETEIAISSGSKFEMANKIIVPIFFGTIFIVGVIGNSLVIFVILKNKKMKTVPNVYILNLAIADNLLLIGIPFLAYQYATSGLWPFGHGYCVIVIGMDGINQLTGIFTLTTMSIDRYLAIARPTEFLNFRTVKTAVIISAGIWIASCLLATPIFIYAKTLPIGDNNYYCTITWSSQIYLHFLNYMFVFGLILPIIIITLFYALLVRSLHVKVIPTADVISANREKTRKAVAKMVMVVVIVFTLCWSPFYIVQYLFNYTEIFTSKYEVVFYTYLFSICLSYANSCVNPIIYSFMSVYFRKLFVKAVMCSSKSQIESITTERNVNKTGGSGSRTRSVHMNI